MKITITPINVKLQAREKKLIIYTSGIVGGSSTVTWDDVQDKPTTFPPSAHTQEIDTITGLTDALAGKQATLVSGTNIKTINGDSILDSGDITISGGGALVDLSDVDATDIGNDKILVYNSTTEKHEYQDKPTDGGGFTKQTLTDAASISWNAENGNYATVTIAGDRTISNPTNIEVGQELILDITQGTGGGHTITWDTYFTFAGDIEPILSSAEGDTDSLRFLVVSTTEIRFTNANFDV